jgi:hypothetical protein
MSHRVFCLAGLILAWALVPAVLAAPTPEPKSKADSVAEKLRKELDQNLSIEIPNTTLAQALETLREHTKLNLVFDRVTAQSMGIDENSMQVNLKVKDVKVRSGLRTLLGQIGLTHVIVGDIILITTEEMAQYRQMKQRVTIDMDKISLTQALKQLSKETAVNIMLDRRMTKQADEALISLQLDDVPLETGVRLMCEMAGLKPARIGNVLFVTSKEKATELRSDPDLSPNPMNPGASGITDVPVPVPVPKPIGPGAVPGAPMIVLPAVPIDPTTPPDKKEEKKDDK